MVRVMKSGRRRWNLLGRVCRIAAWTSLAVRFRASESVNGSCAPALFSAFRTSSAPSTLPMMSAIRLYLRSGQAPACRDFCRHPLPQDELDRTLPYRGHCLVHRGPAEVEARGEELGLQELGPFHAGHPRQLQHVYRDGGPGLAEVFAERKRPLVIGVFLAGPDPL